MSKSSGRARLMGKSTSKVAMGPQRILHMPRRSLPSIAVAVVVVLAWVGGCSDSQGPCSSCPPPQTSGLTVSNPVAAAALAPGVQGGVAWAGSSSDVAYVSLDPGIVVRLTDNAAFDGRPAWAR